jgi:outer membrane protein OmpA-like peptidoglycan-associated protein
MKHHFNSALAISCLMAILALAFSSTAGAQGVTSEKAIVEKLSVRQPPVEEEKIGSMGPGQKPRSVPAEGQGRGTVDLPIPFALNQYLISPGAVPYLVELGKALTHDKLKGYRFEIQGHTCDLGGDEYNLRLSQKRADAVKDYLIRNYNISPAQIQSVGYGERSPLADNSTEEGKARNRRVTILNTLQPFSGKEKPLVVDAQVKYLRGREPVELKPGQTLTGRDNYSVFFKANETSHIYVFQMGADSKVSQLFPNPNFSEAKNPVEAGRQYRLPGRADQWIYLDENKGDEEILIVASPAALAEPQEVCQRILESPSMLLAQEKPKGEGNKVGTMGVRGHRTVLPEPAMQTPPAAADQPLNLEGLFTWRFSFRHQ